MTVNRVILVGNLGADPELRYSNNGDAILSISIATSETRKDKQTGEKKQLTEWHRVVFYGQLAEIVAKYMKKGDTIYVEGKLRTRKWTDQQGVDRYMTEVYADEMKMLGSRRSDASASNGNQMSDMNNDYQRTPVQNSNAGSAQNNSSTSNSGLSDFIDDDIPF
jgi:single-strand DNA-binding protein